MQRKASTAGVTEYKMLYPNGQNRGKNSDDSTSPTPVQRKKIYEQFKKISEHRSDNSKNT